MRMSEKNPQPADRSAGWWDTLGHRIQSARQECAYWRDRLSWSPRLEFPSWRWANKNFEWLSRTHYNGRTVILRNRHKRKILEKLSIDLDKTQIKFKPNKFKSAKYTILTFPILNLFEQFRRAANFYFLVSMILTMLIDSPINPVSWLWSLLFVVLVTMAKQGYEDYLRHKDDAQANQREVAVIKKGKASIIKSEHVMVGDILILNENEQIPCDVILLSSSHDKGQCYIQTSNLDGETSLKTRVSPVLTRAARTIRTVSALLGCVECENPNPKLDSFLGRLTVWTGDNEDDVKVCSLSNENLLLAGTLLKNTREIYAVCVYAGTQTKISLNSKITKNKFSTIERSLNRYLIFLVVVLITEIVSSTVLAYSFNHEFYKGTELYLFSLSKVLHFFGADKETYLNLTNINREDHRDNLQSILGYENAKNYPHREYVQNEHVWYLDQVDDITFVGILEVMLLWMVLYNYIIPLSLYVSLEFQKFVSSIQFVWDIQLYDPDTNEPAQCHTSDINEELGLITHLLTDKTGTITKNEMELRMICREGISYEVGLAFPNTWNTFTMVLTLCHSVQVTDGQFVASSPDEKAILEACFNHGLVYNGELTDGRISVTVQGTMHLFERLAELPFDSYRKCMTVIVRDENGLIHVLCKGAESTMLRLCTHGDLSGTERQIDCYAALGLRTLALGHKTINQHQLDNFMAALDSASQSIVNRATFMREVYEEMEQGLEILGATAIEDKLQDEVLETIHDIRRAGIHIWMLTGDKKETAVNLAHSAGILRPEGRLLDLCDTADPRDTATLLEQMEGEEEESTVSLVIDGKTLTGLFKSPTSVKQLQGLSMRCDTVVACRLSPIQKSQLVRLVKEADSTNLTAAIGDGGNDISMLQEAHVGLGIIGKEGRAAAQASDFAIAKFMFLRRCLLVHGHWFYVRVSFLVQYSFYKNIACFTGQVFFMFFTNFSAQTLFDSMYLFLFNTLYAAFPILVYGMLEQDLPQRTLLNRPALYAQRNARNARMSRYAVSLWLMQGVWHSFVSFFMWYFLCQQTTTSDNDIFFFQTAVSQTCVFIVNLKILLESSYWTWPLVGSVALSILCYVCITALYHSLGPMDNFLINNSDLFMVYTKMLIDPNVWFCTLLAVFIALLPDFLYRVVRDGGITTRSKINQTAPMVQVIS